VSTLDCRGRRCPLPIIELARHITDVEIGASVVLDADDPAAAPDVAAWCRMRGHELLAATTAPDGVPRFEIRRLH
jgi:tRNA 2-thiouridine synthesizing protein A